jgi:hypothetical protein
MGARLVTLVLTYWTDLPERQFRILVRMANTALDTPGKETPAEMYFGGHELLAMTLHGPYPDGDSAEARKARAGVLSNVRREVRALRKAGACEVVDTGRAVRQGHAQTYLLTLGRPNRAGSHRPSSAGSHGPSSAGSFGAIEQGLTDPPRSKEEPSQELSHLDTDGPVVNSNLEGSQEPPPTTDDDHDSGSHTTSPRPASPRRDATQTDRAYGIIQRFVRGRDGGKALGASLFVPVVELLNDGTEAKRIEAALPAWLESGKPPEALGEFVEPPP